MRAAVIEGAAPGEARAAHRALAAMARSDDLERRAWHLAAAALEPDEEIAGLLESAAGSATARRGYAAAAAALARGAELSANDAGRARRRFAAAQAAGLAGQINTARRLLEQVGGEDDLQLRVAVAAAGGRLEFRAGRLAPALAVLTAGAADAGRDDPSAAGALLADAAMISFLAGEPCYLSLGALALVHAQVGDGAGCRLHAGIALEMRRHFDLDYPRDAQDALGLLELSLGNAERAISYLEPANRLPGLNPMLARPFGD